MNGTNGHSVALGETTMALELTLHEAAALRQWLLKPAGDGTTALDDALVDAALKKLGSALDRMEAVASVRVELEDVGFDASALSDEQIADLGRRISQASHRGLR
jgi:hypothetical protein